MMSLKYRQASTEPHLCHSWIVNAQRQPYSTWIKIRPVQKGPDKFQSMYVKVGCVEVDLLIDFCTTSLLGFSQTISAAGYSRQH